MINSEKLQNDYSICNYCKFCSEEIDKSAFDQLQIYIISDVEQLLHFRCQKLENIIDNSKIQYDDLIYYIWNHVAQSFSLQIKMFMKSQESNVFLNNNSKESNSTYCNFFIIIRNLNKKINKQFIMLSEFMEQLLIDAINKFSLEGDQYIDEWLDNRLDFLNKQQPDLVVIDSY